MPNSNITCKYIKANDCGFCDENRYCPDNCAGYISIREKVIIAPIKDIDEEMPIRELPEVSKKKRF
jgi:hypothetical protein